jgi:hypothetical protein
MMDNAVEMQISVGFLDLDLFTSTNISQRSQQVGKAISNAMNNDYVVGAYYTSHWVTVIICKKFKEVWYLDSAKQHPPLKFPDIQPVLNWSVSCRFCSQKFKLLVFLIGIANHAGPLVQYFFSQKFNHLVFLMFLIGIADHAGPLVMHKME